MVDESRIMLVCAQLSSMTCPECGGHHSVTYSKRSSDGLYSWKISNDSCTQFRNLVSERLNNAGTLSEEEAALKKRLLRNLLGR